MSEGLPSPDWHFEEQSTHQRGYIKTGCANSRRAILPRFGFQSKHFHDVVSCHKFATENMHLADFCLGFPVTFHSETQPDPHSFLRWNGD